jgi:hypothetical protein
LQAEGLNYVDVVALAMKWCARHEESCQRLWQLLLELNERLEHRNRKPDYTEAREAYTLRLNNRKYWSWGRLATRYDKSPGAVAKMVSRFEAEVEYWRGVCESLEVCRNLPAEEARAWWQERLGIDPPPNRTN